MDRSRIILKKDKKGKIDYEILNEWQLCPKCNGFGGWEKYNYESFIKNNNQTAPSKEALEHVICDLCNGKKIISKVNGLPPS